MAAPRYIPQYANGRQFCPYDHPGRQGVRGHQIYYGTRYYRVDGKNICGEHHPYVLAKLWADLLEGLLAALARFNWAVMERPTNEIPKGFRRHRPLFDEIPSDGVRGPGYARVQQLRRWGF